MKHARLLPVVLGALLASGGLPALADRTPPAVPAEIAAPEIKPVIEPRATELLKAASKRLADARSMAFTATVSIESPSLYGPPLQYATKSRVTLQRPDKLKVVTPGDGPAFEFYYDGSAMLAVSPDANLAAVTEAPQNIDAALEFAYQKAAIYFPFTDLIVSDPYADLADGMKLAFYIGKSNVVGGTQTDMIAYASDEIFEQIWIGTEDKLPRKIRAVFLKDPLQLRYEMDLTDWVLDPILEPDTFASATAARAQRIDFAAPTLNSPPADAPANTGKSSNAPQGDHAR